MKLLSNLLLLATPAIFAAVFTHNRARSQESDGLSKIDETLLKHLPSKSKYSTGIAVAGALMSAGTLYMAHRTLEALHTQNDIQTKSNSLLGIQNEMMLNSTRQTELISALDRIANAKESPTIRSISLATVSYNHNAIRDSRKKSSEKKRNIESRLKISDARFNRCTFDDNYARLIFLQGDFTKVKITGYFDRCRFQNTSWKESHFKKARFTNCEFDDFHPTTNEFKVENTRFERCEFISGLLVSYVGGTFQDCEFHLSLFDGIQASHLESINFEGEHVVKVKPSMNMPQVLKSLLDAKKVNYTIVSEE